MIKEINFEIKNLNLMKNKPKKLYYIGNTKLLNKAKISIVGTRRPSAYTKDFTYKLAKELAKRDYVIVSGGAMGVDALAHLGAGADNTICVVANGLDIRYPAVNKNLIEQIERQGLVLSFFEKGFKATPWSFVKRNELVVALGEFLIVTEANLNSGSIRSVEFALNMGKKIYVLAHRANESLGTNELLKNNLATPIYDIKDFANSLKEISEQKDEFTLYLETSPTYEEAIKKYGNKIFEAELEGLIKIENGIITLI
jgi:DNA processing protein